MVSVLHTEPVHKHTGSTFEVLAAAQALQPCQNPSTVILTRKMMLHGPAPKTPTFVLMHAHTDTQIQAAGPRMWMGWARLKKGIMCLTGSLSDLSEAAEKQPGGRCALTPMTNVHGAFPIPLLSQKTNATYSGVCVCVHVCVCASVCEKWFSATLASNEWHMNGHIYLLSSEKIGARVCFSVKNGRPLA